jgi:C4-dicarboxylate-specific signal transduction histidine kinase
MPSMSTDRSTPTLFGTPTPSIGVPEGYFDFPHARSDLQIELCLTVRSNFAAAAAPTEPACGINQPLTAIARYAHACERLLTLPDPDLKEVRRALREIGSQVARAGSAIRDLRGAGVAAEPDWISINRVIREMADLLGVEARQHDADLGLELGNALPDLQVPASVIRETVLGLVRKALSNASAAGRRRALLLRTSRAVDGGVSVRVILHDVLI